MPEDPTVPIPPPAADLKGLDAGELFARGLQTAQPSAGAAPWEPPTPEELSKLLPQYRIESLLGRGGMGAVYKGVQAALDRPVAIKLLPAELAANGDFLARFQREARTLAKLQHSGIVAVYDFGQTSAGHLYFVMEYVDGTDLQRILKSPGLRPDQAFVLIAQVCEALHYAHQQGVIHRDIKPANILITKDGRAKVADFGIARPVKDDTGSLTVTNMIMGTPDYMAPEQRTGVGHPDHRADIFALGVMLYEMLTGQRPHGAFQPPSHRVQVDVRIDEVVLKALQQEPDRRYQQASEMKTDVDHIRTTTPGKAKRAGGRRSLITAGAMVAMLLIASIAFFIHQQNKNAAIHTDEVATKQAPPAKQDKPLDLPAPAQPPASAAAIADAGKRLIEARAHLKAGDAGEARKITGEALAAVPGDLGTMADAALILAEAQAPERAAALAGEFAKQAPAEHPQFAAITELRVKLGATMKQYQARLDAAAKLVTARDNAGELRELQAALQLVPDGREAAARLEKNPLHIGRPLPGRPWAGALGHTYVPVDGLPNVLFSIWETRVKDFEQFVKETGHDMGQPRLSDDKSLTWQKPGFEQTGDHPVVMVSREDAEFFCRWLTDKERAAGRLLPGQVYRLPTDREWSAAMGVLDEPGDFPADRQFPKDVFTWPKDTQPKRNAENLNWKNDDFQFTAPVGSGQPNRFGIYDLLGNVAELCADVWGWNSPRPVIRGGCFTESTHKRVDMVDLSSSYYANALRNALPTNGFRCVLDLKTEAQREMQIAFEKGLQKFCDAGTPEELPLRRRVRAVINDEMVLLDLLRAGYHGEPTLSYFADLPVTHLYLAGAGGGAMRVTQKWPLRVLYLPTILNVQSDFLESFRGLPLEWAHLELNYNASGFRTQKSLEALRGMKLKRLTLSWFVALESIEPLRGMPLEELYLMNSAPVDLSPVKDAPLKRVTVPEMTDLKSLLLACDWWAAKVSSFDSSRLPLFENLMRNAAQSGDPAQVAAVQSTLAAKFAAHPSCNGLLDTMKRKEFSRSAELSVRAARLIGGDASAFDGQFQTFNGHSYLYWNQTLTFDEAKAIAVQLGGHLVTITSKEENDFIIQQIGKDGTLLGLERIGPGRMDYKWVTGEPFADHNWVPISRLGGESFKLVEEKGLWVWAERPKTHGSPFIIEWDAPTPQLPVKK